METNRIIAEKFVKEYPLQAAQVLEGINDDEIAAFIEETSVELTVPLLNHMNPYRAAKVIPLLSSDLMTALLENCDISKVEALARQFDEPFRNTILQKLPLRLSAALRIKLDQSADSVGAQMVPVTLPLHKDMIVEEVLELLTKNQDIVETILYVTDLNGKFEGVIKLKDLFFADKTQLISSLITIEVPLFYPDVPVYSVLDHHGWAQYQSIPVVDRSGKLIGILPFEMTRKGVSEKSGQLTKQITETSSALGELYRIGLTGFLQSVGQ